MTACRSARNMRLLTITVTQTGFVGLVNDGLGPGMVAATGQYGAGRTDFVDMPDAHAERPAIESELIRAREERLIRTIDRDAAHGGGMVRREWMRCPAPRSTPVAVALLESGEVGP